MTAVSTSCIILPTESKPGKSNPRLAQYKTCNISNQEERRLKLLQEQKKKRDESFNASRNLIDEIESVQNEDSMEWTSSKARPRVQKTYANRLMFSEWLENVPEDLEESWYLVPCPVGRRALVVASGGYTCSYTKLGIQTAAFKSTLPGGSIGDNRRCTILDCIWSHFNRTYYILDILAWGNQPLLDCETEFRFYWLKTKIEETPSLSEKTDDNMYPFIPLDFHSCDTSIMANIMSCEHIFGKDGPGLDGLLFYHNKTHYVPGSTPLVGWLKPHMLPRVLGVPVAPFYLKQETMETDRRHRRRHRRHKKSSKNMEVEMEQENNSFSSGEMETSVLDETNSSLNTSNEDAKPSNESSESYIEEMEPQDIK